MGEDPYLCALPCNKASYTHLMLLLVTIHAIILILVLTGLFKYLPQHLNVMQRRAAYYLWGPEGDERLLLQLLGLGTNAGSEGYRPGPHKEL